MSAFTPLIAIYNYDPTILAGLHVPTEAELPKNVEYISPIPALSDDTLKQRLLFELGELCPVYIKPDVLKQMVSIFNDVYHQNFLQLWATTLYKYNPIWNKDGSYTETRDLSANSKNSQSGSTSGKRDSKITHDVTGYDTNSMSPAYDDVEATTNSGSSSGSGSNDLKERETLTRKEQGNIGVTTTQAMIKEQRDIVEFNVYDHIIKMFKQNLMIQVWDI